MGQKHSEVERLLLSAGFVLERQGRHNLWRKGEHTFTTHVGTKSDPREIRHARVVIRQAEP